MTTERINTVVGEKEGSQRLSRHEDLAKSASEDERAFTVSDEKLAAGMDAIGAALAHELNQPLTALTLYLQTLKRVAGGEFSDPARELVEKSLVEAERATDIVRRMRRLSVRSEPERRSVDLNELARGVMDLAMVNLPRRPRVRNSLAPDLPKVSGDSVQLQQIIVNLLRNAAEAAAVSRSPAVFLSTAVHEGMVLLTVADNGPGVSPAIAPRLFRAFETSKPNGQGLGLAISRMIAQNHGGDVVLKSAAGESGAVFALKLPL
jgi:two-component system, LuxR family, sensor kinase FixL